MTFSSLFRLVLTLMFLSSCQYSDDPQSVFKNYLYRLSNSLNVPAEPIPGTEYGAVSTLIRYPSVRERNYSIPSANINLVEFLKLSSCELQRHIGQRNSSLGRFMKPSQALFYEYEFIHLAKLCLLQLDSTSDLYQVLSTTLLLKQEQLNLVRWNAIFASDELAEVFSLGAKPLPLVDLKSTPSTLYGALDTLALFLKNTHDNQASVENAYAVISSSKYIGRLRLSMNMIKAYLVEADAMLLHRNEVKPLCFNQSPNARFDIVNTVFMKFYIGDIQPYMALVHQQVKTLFEKVDSLVVSLEPTHEFTLFWDAVYKMEGSEWQQFERAIEVHTKQWQALLTQCGRMPN